MVTGDLDPAHLERLAKEVGRTEGPDAAERGHPERGRRGRTRPPGGRLGRALGVPPARRLDGHQPEEERPLLDVRRPEPAAGRRRARSWTSRSSSSPRTTCMFWDKLERANYFLEAIIDTADRDVDDRTVAYLLEHARRGRRAVEHVRRLVRKHGLVPKAAMPETQLVLEHRADELRPAADAAPGAPATCGRGSRRRRGRRAARAQGAAAGRRPPDALHPPRHAAGDVRLAVDGQGQGVPPRR